MTPIASNWLTIAFTRVTTTNHYKDINTRGHSMATWLINRPSGKYKVNPRLMHLEMHICTGVHNIFQVCMGTENTYTDILADKFVLWVGPRHITSWYLHSLFLGGIDLAEFQQVHTIAWYMASLLVFPGNCQGHLGEHWLTIQWAFDPLGTGHIHMHYLNFLPLFLYIS